MAHYRIKEISAPATILRQGNLLGIELGDFIYPEEVDSIVCSNSITYWDDNTGEHFIWSPVAAPEVKEVVAKPAPKQVTQKSEEVDE